MKFFKKRSVAWVVLVLAVAASVCIGFARKDHFLAKQPTELLDVQYSQWICDDADLLSSETNWNLQSNRIPRNALALPMGELSAKLTERALSAPCGGTSPIGRGKAPAAQPPRQIGDL